MAYKHNIVRVSSGNPLVIHRILLSGINDGDMVKFSYEANEDGQLIITKIEKAK